MKKITALKKRRKWNDGNYFLSFLVFFTFSFVVIVHLGGVAQKSVLLGLIILVGGDKMKGQHLELE